MKNLKLFFVLSIFISLPVFATCDMNAFEACMNTTCEHPEFGKCFCHSDFATEGEHQANISEASQIVNKILSDDLQAVSAGNLSKDIANRLKKANRLLEPVEANAMAGLNSDSLLGEELIPVGSFGTEYGKTTFTKAVKECKAYLEGCKTDPKIAYKTYLKSAQQSCVKLKNHLNSESKSIAKTIQQTEKLFETTKSRKSNMITKNTANCKPELEACMRKACKGIFYHDCYKEAQCESGDCAETLKSVFETKKSKCEIQLEKCGSKSKSTWNEFIEDRIDYISIFLKNLKK